MAENVIAKINLPTNVEYTIKDNSGDKSNHQHDGGDIVSGTVSASYLPAMTGASSSAAGSAGIVPAPAAGDEDKFLSGDGTWTNGYVASFNGSTGAITYTAPVTSVAGHTGSVTLAASDITSGTFAAERIPVATSSAIGGIKVGPTLTIYNNDLNANIMVGATSTSAGSSGYVPMPGPGDVEKFLRGDGSWQTAGSASGVSITRYAATLDPSSWTYNSTYGWYEETVSVQDFTYVSTIKNIEIDVDLSTNNKTTALQIQESWALVGRIYVDSNGLHAICYNDTPTYSIPLLMCVMITGG